MSENKKSGNMYEFVTDYINPVKGKCGFECKYCYMKRFPQNPIGLRVKELYKETEAEKIYFVCSGTDLFEYHVLDTWINATIRSIALKPGIFLYQTKNPRRMIEYIDQFHKSSILCVTIETDIDDNCHKISQAPVVLERLAYCFKIKEKTDLLLWITIEPIMKFTDNFLYYLIDLKPDQINIGADSGHNNLPEPSSYDVSKLIYDLEKAGIVVHKKKNLERLLKDE